MFTERHCISPQLSCSCLSHDLYGNQKRSELYLVLKVRIWLRGFHGHCMELTRSLHCPIASWRNLASPMCGPRKRLVLSFVLHLESYQTEGKIPTLCRQGEGHSCCWTATFPGLFERWVTSFSLQKPQHHCPVSQKKHLPPLCSFPCSWTCQGGPSPCLAVRKWLRGHCAHSVSWKSVRPPRSAGLFWLRLGSGSHTW